MTAYYLNKKKDLDYTGGQINELVVLKNALTQAFIITVLNSEGEITDVNENFTANFKYTLPELYLQDYWILNSGYHSEEFLKGMWDTLKTGGQWSGELCHRAKQGEMIWLKSTIIPIRQVENGPRLFIAISTTITDQKELEKWKYIASHHELTNLPNRRMLEQSLGCSIERVKRKQTKLAVLYMDINRFKTINDTYGHSAGDLFLKEVGLRLSNVETLKNRLFHISGDEFIIIIEEVESLKAIVQSIMDLFNRAFIIGNYQIQVSVSIGMSMYPTHSTDPMQLIKYADLAMFDGKGQDVNTFQIYAPSMRLPAEKETDQRYTKY